MRETEHPASSPDKEPLAFPPAGAVGCAFPPRFTRVKAVSGTKKSPLPFDLKTVSSKVRKRAPEK